MEQAAVSELLMIERIEQQVACRGKMALRRLRLCELAQHRQKMNTMSHETRILEKSLPGRRNSDNYFLLTSQPMQKKLKT
jgi:hypothetical protein